MLLCRAGYESGVGLRSSDHRGDFLSHSVVSSGLARQCTQSLPGQNHKAPIYFCFSCFRTYFLICLLLIVSKLLDEPANITSIFIKLSDFKVNKSCIYSRLSVRTTSILDLVCLQRVMAGTMSRSVVTF